jgi:hypothetical protein
MVGAAFMMFSCSEDDDPLPSAEPSFEVITANPEVGMPVKFGNLSKNASSYEWNFGDGSATSTAVSPTHTYDDAGTYMVTLTATTEDDQVSKDSMQVKIGQRLLTGIFINDINFFTSDGMPWDEDSGPDVIFFIYPVSDEASGLGNGGNPVENVLPRTANPVQGQNYIPFGYEIPTTGADFPVVLTDEEWGVELYDYDPGATPAEDDFQNMISFAVNPVTNSTAIVDEATGEGVLRLVSRGFDVFITFEID